MLKVDGIGMTASLLCMAHCIATPFLFIAKSCSVSCCDASPTWWSWLDYLFLVVSFFAVWQTSKTTSKRWIRYALWVSWLLLFAIIVNEKLQLLPLPETTIYFPAVALVGLHFYNLKYCHCTTNECCAKSIKS